MIVVLNLGDDTIVRPFPDEALAPAADFLAAGAAARRGERKIDPLAALVRNALAAERRPRPIQRATAPSRVSSPLSSASVTGAEQGVRS